MENRSYYRDLCEANEQKHSESDDEYFNKPTFNVGDVVFIYPEMRFGTILSFFREGGEFWYKIKIPSDVINGHCYHNSHTTEVLEGNVFTEQEMLERETR